MKAFSSCLCHNQFRIFHLWISYTDWTLFEFQTHAHSDKIKNDDSQRRRKSRLQLQLMDRYHLRARTSNGGYQLCNECMLEVAPLATGTRTTPNGSSGDSVVIYSHFQAANIEGIMPSYNVGPLAVGIFFSHSSVLCTELRGFSVQLYIALSLVSRYWEWRLFIACANLLHEWLANMWYTRCSTYDIKKLQTPA